MLFECGNKLFVKKYSDLTLLAIGLCCVMPRTSRTYFQHMFPPLLLGLYCCPFGDAGQAGLGLGCPPPTHTILQACSLYSRIQTFLIFSRAQLVPSCFSRFYCTSPFPLPLTISPFFLFSFLLLLSFLFPCSCSIFIVPFSPCPDISLKPFLSLPRSCMTLLFEGVMCKSFTVQEI